jgi:hypothetical protein
VAVVVAVLAVVAVDLLLSLWPLAGRQMALRALEEDNPNLLNQAALLEGLLGVAYLLIFLACAVLVIVWLYRARRNLDAFPGAHTTMRAGWAITGWLVPFVNLVVPARVMANVARASLWRSRTPALVGIWRAAWLLSNIVEVMVASADTYGALPQQIAGEADYRRYVEYYESALGPHLIELAVTATAGIALSVLVLRISRAQQARIARGQPSGPLMPGQVMTRWAGGDATIGA